MRRRITKAFFATAAAGATITTLGFAAASPAGAAAGGIHFTPSAPETATDANVATCTFASGDSSTTANSTGTWTSSDCGKAGYVATGRNFRYASAIVKVPTFASGASATITGPSEYVALDASATNPDYAEVGVRPDPDGDGSWEIFYDVQEPCSSATTGSAALNGSAAGDGVAVSVYFNQAGNSVHVVATPPPGTGTPINQTIATCGPVYTDAQALADWSQAAEDATPPAFAPAVPTAKTRDTQFFQGRFTTLSGAQGTFKGPWTLAAVDATTNGSLEPAGTLIGQPSYLWNDGSSFGGLGSDAFGVWRFPNG
jgi:hypothetical protein